MEELRFIPSSKLHQQQAVTKHPIHRHKVYTWSSRGKSVNKEGEEVRYFACTGCRALKDGGRNVQLPVRRANITLKMWEPTCGCGITGAYAKMCVFHILQAINRRLQQLGLQTLYQEGGHVRSITRRIGAIITVPPEYMDDSVVVMSRAVDRIDVPADVKAKLRSLLDYFDNTWVENHLGKVFLAMLLLGPGTTNHAESYHGRLRDHFPRSHPKLGEWMVTFKELNNHEEEQAEAVLRGNVQPNIPSAVFQVVQQRRLDLRHRFDDFLETDFSSDEFRSECYRYLGRMANLLGISPQTRNQRRDARVEKRARL